MRDKKKHRISAPLPLKDQETVLSRMHGDSWTIDTSEPVFERLLRRKNYTATGCDGVGHYVRFELPMNGITIRDRNAVEEPHQSQNLPNGSKDEEGRGSEVPEVGEETTEDRAIEDEDVR